MPQRATYYFGRVIKLGTVTQSSLLAALREPPSVKVGDFVYTITNALFAGAPETPTYIFATLTKYTPEGAIAVVEPSAHREAMADVKNLVVASSNFIYLPEYSGIAYQHIWNKLQREQFERAFSAIIEERHGRFFAQSFIEPISNLATFVSRISTLSSISKIEATVHPPNPLFGRSWAGLRAYMKARRTAEVHVREVALPEQSLQTSVPQIAAALQGLADAEAPSTLAPLGNYESMFADAAVLMAADGYGKARIEGQRAGRRVVVRTLDSQVSEQIERDIEPAMLYEQVQPIFARISEDRYMEHGDEKGH